jgi:hypothetical protein
MYPSREKATELTQRVCPNCTNISGFYPPLCAWDKSFKAKIAIKIAEIFRISGSFIVFIFLFGGRA